MRNRGNEYSLDTGDYKIVFFRQSRAMHKPYRIEIYDVEEDLIYAYETDGDYMFDEWKDLHWKFYHDEDYEDLLESIVERVKDYEWIL